MAHGKKTGGGSRKGCPNRATVNAREAIGRLIGGNVHLLQQWLDEVYQKDGAKAALKCFMSLIEYHVPKLARHEHSNPNGTPINFMFCIPPKVEPHE